MDNFSLVFQNIYSITDLTAVEEKFLSLIYYPQNAKIQKIQSFLVTLLPQFKLRTKKLNLKILSESKFEKVL